MLIAPKLHRENSLRSRPGTDGRRRGKIEPFTRYSNPVLRHPSSVGCEAATQSTGLAARFSICYNALDHQSRIYSGMIGTREYILDKIFGASARPTKGVVALGNHFYINNKKSRISIPNKYLPSARNPTMCLDSQRLCIHLITSKEINLWSELNCCELEPAGNYGKVVNN